MYVSWCAFFKAGIFFSGLHFVNHKGPQYQLKIFFTGMLRKKNTYICDDLRLSKLTANVPFLDELPPLGF